MWVRMILHFIIPFTSIGYIPVLLLRGENQLLNLLLIICISAAFFALARWVFYRSIRKYESMGM
jgi:ABC-type uncharacterized transport system permease subunit